MCSVFFVELASPSFNGELAKGPHPSLLPPPPPPLFSQCEAHGPPIGVGREKNEDSADTGKAVEDISINTIATEIIAGVQLLEDGTNTVHNVNGDDVAENPAEKEKLNKENVEDIETDGAETETLENTIFQYFLPH